MLLSLAEVDFPADVRMLITVACWALFAAASAGVLASMFTWYCSLVARREFASKADLAKTQHDLEAVESRIAEDVKSAIEDVKNQQRALFAKLDQQASTLQKHSNSVALAIGRIEGKLGTFAPARDADTSSD